MTEETKQLLTESHDKRMKDLNNDHNEKIKQLEVDFKIKDDRLNSKLANLNKMEQKIEQKTKKYYEKEKKLKGTREEQTRKTINEFTRQIEADNPSFQRKTVEITEPGSSELFEQVCNALESFEPKNRGEELKNMCEMLKKNDTPLNTGSSAVADPVSENPKFTSILENLDSKNFDKETFTKIESKDFEKAIDLIAKQTGYHLLTEKKAIMVSFRIKAPMLDDYNFASEHREEFRAAFLEDLARTYGIDKTLIDLKGEFHGCLEYLFSIPEGTVGVSLTDERNFPRLNTILKKYGIEKVEREQMNKEWDIETAKALLSESVLPLKIKSDNSNKNEITNKYFEYLPLLACISSKIEIIEDKIENCLKIYGDPEEKANIQHYLIRIEKLLKKSNHVPVVNITTDLDPIPKIGELKIWNDLIKNARFFAKSSLLGENFKTLFLSIKENEYLAKGYPSANKFINGLNKLGFNNSDNIMKLGQFAWYGISSNEELMNILRNRIDSEAKNNNSFYGEGNYFGTTTSICQKNWGDVKILIVFFLITQSNPNFTNTNNGILVLKNPQIIENIQYCVPILFVQFMNKSPPKIVIDEKVPVYQKPISCSWEWKDDNCWRKYGYGQLNEFEAQHKIQQRYSEFEKDKFQNTIELNLIRICDSNLQKYLLSFSEMKQTNTNTGFKRCIRNSTSDNTKPSTPQQIQTSNPVPRSSQVGPLHKVSTPTTASLNQSQISRSPIDSISLSSLPRSTNNSSNSNIAPTFSSNNGSQSIFNTNNDTLVTNSRHSADFSQNRAPRASNDTTEQKNKKTRKYSRNKEINKEEEIINKEEEIITSFFQTRNVRSIVNSVEKKFKDFHYSFMTDFQIENYDSAKFKNIELKTKTAYIDVLTCFDAKDTPCLMKVFNIYSNEDFSEKLSVFVSQKQILDRFSNNEKGYENYCLPAFYGGFYEETPKGFFSKLILVTETGHHTLSDLINIRKKEKNTISAYSSEETLDFLYHIAPCFLRMQNLNIFHGGICLENIMYNSKMGRYFLTNLELGIILSEEENFDSEADMREYNRSYHKGKLVPMPDEFQLWKYFDFKKISQLKEQEFYAPEVISAITEEKRNRASFNGDLILFKNIKFNPFKYDIWALGNCLRKMVGDDELLNEELKTNLEEICKPNWKERWDATELNNKLSFKNKLKRELFMEAKYIGGQRKENIFNPRRNLFSEEREMDKPLEKDGNIINDFFLKKIPKDIRSRRKINKPDTASFGKNLDDIKEGLKAIQDKDERLSSLIELLKELNVTSDCNFKSEPVADRISIDPTSKDIIEKLKDHGCPAEFFETVPRRGLEDLVDQIENVTGVNLITNTLTEMKKIKISSEELEERNLLINGKEAIRDAFAEDLANFYKIKKQDLKIRILTSGSLELLISIPELKKDLLKLKPEDFPTLAQILKRNGIGNFNVNEDKKLPDRQKAVEMLQTHGLPITIISNEKESDLRKKFSPYFPALASLSKNIKIKHDQKNGELKIYGSQEAKAAYQHYLIKIDNILNKNPNQGIVIIEQKDPEIEVGQYSIWVSLFEKAKELALQYTSNSNPMNPESIQFNKNLQLGFPVAVKFVSGLIHLGFDPKKDLETILQSGVFAWHGTKSEDAIRDIAANNLNPAKRTTQLFGIGEYFGKTAQISQGYWGNTNTLFVFFLLTRFKDKKGNDAFKNTGSDVYVLNNPNVKENKMFCVPLLTVTFNNKEPCKFLPNEVPANQSQLKCKWRWRDDDGWKDYGVGQKDPNGLQKFIEEKYIKYQRKNDPSNQELEITIIRICDKVEQKYKVNFQNLRQINGSTHNLRNIERVDM